MKLYPPIIEGKIPAQSGTVLKIPFRLNRSVGVNQIGCVIARIKTVSTNHWKGTYPEITDDVLVAIQNNAYRNFGPDAQGQYYTDINLHGTNIGLVAGQYYKVQLAFCDTTGQIGYFSSIGIFKYTTNAKVYIEGLDGLENELNGNLYDYIGRYDQAVVGGDTTEKVYSYKFDFYRMSDNCLIVSTGTLIHNSSNDNADGWSQDFYELETSLQEGENYLVQYTVNTVNGLTISSPRYIIVANDSLPNAMGGKLIAENDFENGRVNLRYIFRENDPSAQWIVPFSYGFIISRSSAESDFSVWRDIYKFSVDEGGAFPDDLGADYTVEQGEQYRYAVQFYQPTGLRSQRKESETVYVDFEDIFLYDGARQLKVRFNPKVNSFKVTTLETKLDTIGGKYPFFFRNGNISYREFPISGLISYLMDESQNFMSDLELGFISTIDAQRITTPASGAMIHKYFEREGQFRSTNQTGENFKAERLFKMQVLEWLNNGKPKLFRSPAEGNFIVRLMNVSLSPSEQINRLLHSFNGNAYEVAECTYKNMVKYGFVPEKRYENKILLYMTEDLNLGKYLGSGNWSKSFSADGGAYKMELREVKPGTIFEIWYKDAQAAETIMVGATGTYTFNIYETPISSIRLLFDPYNTKGYLDYGFYTAGSVADFSEVHNIFYSEQLIDFAHPYTFAKDDARSLFTFYENTKQKINHLSLLKFSERRIQTVYKKNNKYYDDPECTVPNDIKQHDRIYKIANTETYIDGFTSRVMTNKPDYTYMIEFKDGTISVIDISGPGEITYRTLNEVKNIYIGSGVHITGTYQQAEYLFGVEIDGSNDTIARLHTTYEEAKKEFLANATDANKAAVKTALNNLNAALNSNGYGEG